MTRAARHSSVTASRSAAADPPTKFGMRPRAPGNAEAPRSSSSFQMRSRIACLLSSRPAILAGWRVRASRGRRGAPAVRARAGPRTAAAHAGPVRRAPRSLRSSRDVAGILSSLEFRILRSGGEERRAGGPQRFPADVFTASPTSDSSVCETSRPSRPARTGERGESQMALSRRLLVLFALCAVQPDGRAWAAAPTAGTVTATGPAVSWTGTAAATTSVNETTCVEGVSCDTFTLTVAGSPADYTGKVIAVKIQWTNSLNDYDLYIHKDSNGGPLVGSSGNGAPQTSEESAIDPGATGTGVYTVHVVYFTVTPMVDQYQGSASVQAKSVARTATYVQGGISFSSSVRLKAPVARRDGEPSNRTDPAGNAYVTAIRGVPAGVDLWV